MTRRRQLVNIRTSERIAAIQPALHGCDKSIDTVITTLDREIAEVDADIDDLIRNSPLWREEEED